MPTLSCPPPGAGLGEWLACLERIDPSRIELGLGRVREVLRRLGLNFGDATVVEVAGTNGKGSTAALVAEALRGSGHTVGLYTSPHLLDFRERIEVNGRMVEERLLCAAFSAVAGAAAREPGVDLTYFEFTTLAALWCFHESKAGALVLEVGLGGRLDAVNAIDADVAVIASIGLDHTALLGGTEELIAAEKAGIIKPSCELVLGRVGAGAREVILKVARERGATAQVLGEGCEGGVDGAGLW
nr:bifunctional tetrahydrofolate synthase/dihydrofolate synthase [Succinivibrionaceae bacterium]